MLCRIVSLQSTQIPRRMDLLLTKNIDHISCYLQCFNTHIILGHPGVFLAGSSWSHPGVILGDPGVILKYNNNNNKFIISTIEPCAGIVCW